MGPHRLRGQHYFSAAIPPIDTQTPKPLRFERETVICNAGEKSKPIYSAAYVYRGSATYT